jgi:tRNA pseudouridine55 synthase
MISGFLVVDKPAGITSHDVVAVLRSTLQIKKIGHTGTLDPFATGVLPLAIGPSTRLIQYLDEGVKRYDATISLGRSTDTGDLMGEVVGESSIPPLEPASVQTVLDGFCGEQMQTPPAYSAVKVDGKPLYKYAREGKSVDVAAKKIRIDSVELLGLRENELEIRVQCGRGTYVRVLGEEIAVALGTHGHLCQLRRLCSGPFDLNGALRFETLSQLAAGRDDWKPVLRPERGAERVQWADTEVIRAGVLPRLTGPRAALSHLPEHELSEIDRESLQKRGRVFSLDPGVADGACWLAVYEGQLIAVLRREGSVGRVARMIVSG